MKIRLVQAVQSFVFILMSLLSTSVFAQERTGAYYRQFEVDMLNARIANNRYRVQQLQRTNPAEVANLNNEIQQFQARLNSINQGAAAANQPLSAAEERDLIAPLVSSLEQRINSNNQTIGLYAQNIRHNIQGETDDLTTRKNALQARLQSLGSQQPASNGGGSATAACQEIIEAQCGTPTQDANRKCDADQNEGVRNARSELSTVGNTSTQMANMAATANANSATGANGPTSGVAQTCSMMANIAAGVNGAIAAYRLDCSSAYDSCKDQCGSLLSKLRSDRNLAAGGTRQVPACQQGIEGAITRVQELNTQCTRLSSRAAEASNGMQGTAANLLSGATRCIENTVAGGLEVYCQQNPSAAVCANLTGQAAINCDDGSSAAASATICICRRNPYDSRCGGQNSNQNIVSNNSLGGAPLSGTPVSGQDLNTGLDGSDPINANLTPGQEVGGRKMSLPGVGSGDSLQASEGGHGGGRAPFDPFNGPKIFGRTGGGSGQGGGWPSGRPGSGSGTGIYGKNSKGMGDGSMRDFLPFGAQDPNRGLAGSASGLLGPNVNIWEKINNRYVDHSLTKQSLLPPNYRATPQEVQRRPGQ